MYMIGHNRPFIQRGMGEMQRDILPALCRDFARIIQPHDPVGDSPEQTFPMLHAYRHEIGPGLRVIIIAQADGTAMVDVGVVFHGRLFTTGRVVGAGPRACPELRGTLTSLPGRHGGLPLQSRA